MSTFDGRIREYPAVAIDKFTPNSSAKYFLLSHVHSDHMRGLEDCKFNKQIYCTEESASILPYIAVRHNKQPKYRHMQNYLIPVKYGLVVKLNTPEYGVISFQFLPANHCIGSAMILLEGRNGSILYTGDTRAEPDFFEQELKIIKRRRIQNLYMDTTCIREEYNKFISKRKSVELLLSLIRNQEEHHHIYIDCWTFGYEECWVHIADSFNQKVHVSQLKYNTFVAANPIYKEYLTTNSSETRFHSCDWEQDCQQYEHGLIAIHFKPTMDDQPRIYIHSETSNQLLQSDLKYTCKPQTRHILPFSYHSSLEEIIAFTKYVNAKTFTACVARGGYEGMERMRKLMIERGCKLGAVSHSSDLSSTDILSPLNKRRRASSESTSFKKIYSETLSDPETHSPYKSGNRSGSGSTWATRSSAKQTSAAMLSANSKTTVSGGGSLPIASKPKFSSIIEEKALPRSPIPTKNSNSNEPKSNAQPQPCPQTVQPLNDCTNEIKSLIVEETSQNINDTVPISDSVNSEHCSNPESSMSLELIDISPMSPEVQVIEKPDDDSVIVISSDEEDSKPFLTRRETRRFIRELKSCSVKRNKFIANFQA